MQKFTPLQIERTKCDTVLPAGNEIGDTQKDFAPRFELGLFFPYLVRVYYRDVTQAIQNVYAGSYDLTVSEWRILVVLGPDQSISAREIVKQSSLDKVNVSRAVAGLRQKELLVQHIDKNDRRRSVLQLTVRGKAVYDVLVPKVLACEKALLRGLSDEEQTTLKRLMAKVRENADALSDST